MQSLETPALPVARLPAAGVRLTVMLDSVDAARALVASVGATPTALFAQALPGITELRAGVWGFQGLVMAGLGVRAPTDILPNHACATCAQFDAYQVIDAANPVQARWPRFGGW